MILPSLRSRLLVLILLPLFAIAAATAIWQFRGESLRAEETFDRGLLSAALAISRDVAISDGDALSPTTRRLLNNTSGGELFYHVYAPDGVFVTGYATPPVVPPHAQTDTALPTYFNGRYQGRDVRVLRFQYVTTVADVSGAYNVTVWQDINVRRNFVRDAVLRSVAVSSLIILCVGFVVWFGIGFGLRPLLELEAAIARRTPTDLDPIKREVPVEARGLVKTLNALLDRISRRISSKDEFISNAAHQLRNPVAGVLALAEAVESAPTPEAAKKRSAELVDAARQASQLTNQLLSYERAAGSDVTVSARNLDLCQLSREILDDFIARLEDDRVILTRELPSKPVSIVGDPVMLREAILNLLNNALTHGGPTLREISFRLRSSGADAHIVVADDGVGIPSDKHTAATMRFGQANGGRGSGLGIPIAARVASNHGGTLEILHVAKGAAIQLSFPVLRA